MRIPDSLTALTEEGIIDEVLRPLMSGKEAQVFLVRCGEEERVAKVYKDADHRTFKQRAEYTEGRKVRNTRDQRALAKGSRYGREQDEATWRATEVEMIQRLHPAGVRVPTPYHFIDGVLIMELIADAEGNPAARLGDIQCDRETALEIYEQLLREVVRMLCAGVVHGDLSDFNVLLDANGPVIIDFPQSVNAAGNTNARKLLLRDVDNLHRWLTRFVPERQPLPYAEEMWQLYQRGELTPDVKLSGRFRASETKVDTRDLLGLVADAEQDERRRRQRLGLSGGPNPRGDSPARNPNARNQTRARGEANAPGSQGRDANTSQGNARNQPQARGEANARGFQGREADARDANARNQPQARGDTNVRGFQGRDANAPQGNARNQPQVRGDASARGSQNREADARDANTRNQPQARGDASARGFQSREADARDANARNQPQARGDANARGFQSRDVNAHQGAARNQPQARGDANRRGFQGREADARDANARNQPQARGETNVRGFQGRDANAPQGNARNQPQVRGDASARGSQDREADARDAHARDQPQARGDVNARGFQSRDTHAHQASARNSMQPRGDAQARSAGEGGSQTNAKRGPHQGSNSALPAKASHSREVPRRGPHPTSPSALPAKASQSREAPRRSSHPGSTTPLPEHGRGHSRTVAPLDRTEPQPANAPQRLHGPDRKPPHGR